MKQQKKDTANGYFQFLELITAKYCGWLIFGIVSFLLLFVFRGFICGKFYYLFTDSALDSLIINYPKLFHIAGYLRSEGFPMWSFAQGMGQNIMATSLADPFYWIIYIAGPSHAAYSIMWMEIVKFLLTALVIYHFLKLWDLTYVSRITGTLLYCFSGFMFVGSEWRLFSTEAFFLSVLLLSFEKLYRQNSWHLFPIAVALLAAHNPFKLYTSSVFLFFYFLFRHFSSEKPGANTFFRLILKMCCLGALGILISSFLFIPNIQYMIESPRVSGGFSCFNKLNSLPFFCFEKQDHYVTAVLRFFSNDLMGNGLTYSGWHNYLEAPLFYIGLLPLLLTSQILILFKKRQLIAHVSFLSIFLLPVIFPYFRYAFFLFTGDYYRCFSFFVALSLLFSGLYVLDKINGNGAVNPYFLLGSCLILILILYFPYDTAVTNINILDGSSYPFCKKNDVLSINSKLRFIICVFLMIYSLLIYLFRYKRYKTLLRIILILGIMIEVAYMNSNSLTGRYALTPFSLINYTDGKIKDAVDYIHAIDKGLYRTNVDVRLTSDINYLYNMAKICGYFGTTSYDSFNQKYYIRFLEEMNMLKKGDETNSRWANGLIFQPLLWPFASIKYHIGINSDMILQPLGLDPIKQIGDITVYKNSSFLPFGYTYNQYIPISRFKMLSDVQKALVLQKAIVVEEPIDPKIKSTLNEFNLEELSERNSIHSYFQDIAKLNQNTLNMTGFTQNYLEGTIILEKAKWIFFSIPYDKGWSAEIDNRKIKPQLCNVGFLGFILEPGYHTIRLSYLPPYFYSSLMMSISGLSLYLGFLSVIFFYNRRPNHTLR